MGIKIELMINELEHLGKSFSNSGPGYTKGQLDKLASYLVGQTAFEEVEPFLIKSKDVWVYNIGVDKRIGLECANDTRLLPRLGRYMKVLFVIDDKMAGRVAKIMLQHLKADEVFLQSGWGVEWLLWFVFEQYGEIEHPLETIHDLFVQNPSDFERMAKSENMVLSLMVKAFLIHEDAKKYKKHFEDMIELAMCFVVAGKEEEEKIAKLKELAADKKIKSVVKAAKSISKKQLLHLKNYQYTENRIAQVMLITALKIPEINFLFDFTAEFTKGNSYNFFRNTLNSLKYGSRFLDETEVKPYEYVPLEMVKEAGLNPAYYLLYLSHQYLFSYIPVLNEIDTIEKENPFAIIDAIKATTNSKSAFLARKLWAKGDGMEYAKKFEEEFLHMMKTCQNAQDLGFFIEWLQGGNSQVDLPANPDLSKHYLGSAEFYIHISMIYDVSPVVERFIGAMLSYNEIGKIDGILARFRNYYEWDLQKTKEYLLSFGMEPAAILTLWANLCTDAYVYHTNDYQAYLSETVKEYPELVKSALEKSSAKGRVLLIETLYELHSSYDPTILLESIGDGSKMVRDLVCIYLQKRPETREFVEPLVNHKKKATRDIAEKIIQGWEMQGGNETPESDFDVAVYCAKNLNANARKSLAWLQTDAMPKLHWKESGTLVDEQIFLCYIYLYVSQKTIEIPPKANQIRAMLKEDDLHQIAAYIYHVWMAAGAQAKQRGALLFVGVHADNLLVNEIRKQVDIWAEHARGAIASEAMRALAFGGSDLALMMVDAAARKFKNKQVRRACEEAFAETAKVLGIDPEELSDKIVPNLGFDEKGEQVIDFGTRKFIAMITPKLQISLKTEEGKVIKTLPKPGVNDNEEMAEKAKKAFSALKKSLKSVVNIQAVRLESALSSGRSWSYEAWLHLFVHNPIMNMFAVGLIWGIYKDGVLEQSFRYMEDGTFNTSEEEELELPNDAVIALVHPLDMDEELLTAWREQLSDYEIVQPINQLNRSIYKVSEEQMQAENLKQFGGIVMPGISLLGKLQKLFWYKGSVQDGGWYQTFYKEDKSTGIGVQLNFSGMGVAYEMEEQITLYELIFYKSGTVERGSYIYDDVKKNDIIKLGDIPKRLYSEICYDMEQATASKIKVEENWETMKSW